LGLRRLVPLAMGACHPVLSSSETRRRPLLLLLLPLLLGLRHPVPPRVRLRRLVLLRAWRFGRLVLPRLGLRRPILRLLLRWTTHCNLLLRLYYRQGRAFQPISASFRRRL